MGFAGAYLRKAGVRGPLVQTDPHPGLNIIVTIPVYNESGLERCLDSLFSCLPASPGTSGSGSTDPGPSVPVHAEVLILVNAPKDAPAEVLEQNRLTMESARSWISGHPHPSAGFHIFEDHSFSGKKSGVGLARKILMDEASRRFSKAGNPLGIIASLDADTVVERSYLSVLVNHFQNTGAEGCSIYYEHPLSPEEDPDPEKHRQAVYDAIAQYELHLRYYVNSVRATGYPYAYHTVGSAFAVRADVYCMEGGMNRRRGGEDFYFIQKVSQRGYWSECNSTLVLASPRPSGRAPFGTGRMIHRLVKEKPELATYNPASFRILREFFSQIGELYDRSSALEMGLLAPSQGEDRFPFVLTEFLRIHDFRWALNEIRSNSASPAAFQKRFWRWFNWLRIMKFLHFARENGYPDIEVTDAVKDYLRTVSIYRYPRRKLPSKARDLLILTRLVDLSADLLPG